MTLLFVVPIRRDRRVATCVARLRDFGNQEGMETEILLCGELLEGQDCTGARFIRVKPPLKGNCVRAGVAACKGTAVIVCDADVPIEYRDLRELIRSLESHEAAFGHRFLQTSGFAVRPPLSRRLASRGFRVLVSRLFNLVDVDTQCGVKAFRSTTARAVLAQTSTRGLAYDVEVVATAVRLGLSICQVPVCWSHLGSTIRLWSAGPSALFELLLLRWRHGLPSRMTRLDIGGLTRG